MPTFEWTSDFCLKTAKSLKLRGNAWVSAIPASWLNLGLATTVEQPGSQAANTYVPSGWQTEPNVYDIVIKPYCRSCHMTLDDTLDLTSHQQFLNMKPPIQASVCRGYTMPHAEVPFQKFWRSAPLYIPGYLEDPSVLGVSNCTLP